MNWFFGLGLKHKLRHPCHIFVLKKTQLHVSRRGLNPTKHYKSLFNTLQNRGVTTPTNTHTPTYMATTQSTEGLLWRLRVREGCTG